MRRINQLITMCVAVMIILLSACAAPQSLVQIQSDLAALRAEVAGLSERFDRLDRQLSPPEPPRVSVDFSGRPVLGDSAARVGIVEFSDFQCPYCRRFHAAVQPVLKKNYIDTGKVQMIFRDLPLEFHPLAKPAAMAVNCAGAQGHYWEMADALFDNQERLGDDLYLELADRFDLDPVRYQACLKDPSGLKAIEQGMSEAAALGIDGTPSFLIGRVEGGRLVDALMVVGAQPYPAFAQVIDSILDGQATEAGTR